MTRDFKVVETSRLVPITNCGKTLIGKRDWRAKSRASTWEFLGGKVEAGEKIGAAAVREFFEEAGVKLRRHVPEAVYGVSDIEPGKAFTRHYVVCFGAPLVRSLVVDYQEHSECRWVRFDEAYDLLGFDPDKRALEAALSADIPAQRTESLHLTDLAFTI